MHSGSNIVNILLTHNLKLQQNSLKFNKFYFILIAAEF